MEEAVLDRSIWTSWNRGMLVAGALALAVTTGCGRETVERAGDAMEDVAERVADARVEGSRHPLDVRRVETRGLDSARIAQVYARAAELPRLRCLLVARHGEIQEERCFRGPAATAPANVKSVSKSILSAAVGIAVAEGKLSVDQPIAPFFSEHLGADADPRKRAITVGNLLSMQSGLERTSGGNYGRWVGSANWVRYAITRPMAAEPGGPMLYSTGNSHLLSAILTEATGISTYAYARDRLFAPLGVRLAPWPTDPQGIYFGGNEMRVTPRAMVRFGEMYRNGGRHEGRQVVPEAWVRASLEARTRSPWSGESYGYGWFVSQAGGHPMFYAWGYGGQFIFVVPDLELTVVTTSDPDDERDFGHLGEIRSLLRDGVVPAARAGADGGARGLAAAGTAPPAT
jgi:CubicO group peptidase (beta-lactamase class C family)